jgi:UDP-GlcNAc:undecaprenyl-phosphate GlcNAc-1-phosphate transferase
MKTYLIVWFGSALLAIFGTPIATRIARRVGLLDLPGVRKIHAAPVARIGGVIIAFAALSVVLPTLLLDNTIGLAFRKDLVSITALLATSLSMLMLGLVDDVRGVRALVKLLCQVGAATVVCAVGIRIDSINLPGLGEVTFGVLSWPITIMWIVGITNAVNLIDGLDGLAAGISAIACGVIAVVAIYTGQLVMAVLMLALLGSLTGFLFFNSNPAKVFMGDSGTLFVGFMTAAASVMCATKSEMLVGLALPALALGVPIFDTSFSVLRRVLERRSIFAPDRRHIHHRLLD